MLSKVSNMGSTICRRSLSSTKALRPVVLVGHRFCSGTPERMLPFLPPFVEEVGPVTAAPIEKAKALHPSFYTDSQYVQAERERIFGTQWFAACHTAELANPGDVKVIEVGTNSIILTCDKNGKIHAFYNVCRHRGAKVCSSDQTGCKQLVCPYHWWSYRLDGSLKSTPPAVTPQERKSELGLRPVPHLDTFAGVVFLNQSKEAPSLQEYLGDLPDKLKRYDLDNLEFSGKKEYKIGGDWKLIAENFVDFYHINAVHPELSRFSRVDDHQPYQGPGQYIGFVTNPLTNSGGPGDLHNFNLFPNLNPVEATSAFFFQLFPNISVTVYPHSVYTLMTFPTSTPGVTKESLTLLMAPGARKQEDSDEVYKEKCEKLLAFVVNINDEDVVAIENLQLGLQNAREHGLHGEFLPKYDWSVHRFQNMILDGLHGRTVNEELTPELDTTFADKVKSA